MPEDVAPEPLHPIMQSMFELMDAGVLLPESSPIPHSHTWGMNVDREVLNMIAAQHLLPDATEALLHLALMLWSMEKGEMDINEEDATTAFTDLRLGAVMCGLARDGLLQKADTKSLFDGTGTWQITDAGRATALADIQDFDVDTKGEG